MNKIYTAEYLAKAMKNKATLPELHPEARPGNPCPVTGGGHVIEKLYPDYPEDIPCPYIGCVKCGLPVA